MSANGYLNEGSFDDFWGGAGRDEIYIGDKPVPYYWLDTAKDATSEDNLHEIGWLGFVGHGQFYWTTCTARRFTSSHHQGRAEAGVRQESRGVMAPLAHSGRIETARPVMEAMVHEVISQVVECPWKFDMVRLKTYSLFSCNKDLS